MNQHLVTFDFGSSNQARRFLRDDLNDVCMCRSTGECQMVVATEMTVDELHRTIREEGQYDDYLTVEPLPTDDDDFKAMT